MELNNIWKKYDQALESANILNLQSWVVHLQTVELLKTEKAKSRLRSLGNCKKGMVLIGILWVAFLIFVLASSIAWSKIFLTLSVAAILAFSIYSVLAYIWHIVLIDEIDNSESLIEVQKKTATLKASTLNSTRILFLQTPFYSTFFWNWQWMSHDPKFWMIAFPVSLLLTAASIWLYRNIDLRNADKRWFKMLFSGKDWTAVIRAMKYLKEIEDYKKEAGS
ncbi:MAG TPA: hypothetical protein VHD83_09740 [Puia sp.]|nr:hypothetical protein [Puia sp.]